MDALVAPDRQHIARSTAEATTVSCDVCGEFKRRDSISQANRRILVEAQQSAKSGCARCHLLVTLLRQIPEGQAHLWWIVYTSPLPLTFELYDSHDQPSRDPNNVTGKYRVHASTGKVMLHTGCLVSNKGNPCRGNLPLAEAERSTHSATEQALSLLKRWLKDCDESHQACNAFRGSRGSGLPTRVVEILGPQTVRVTTDGKQGGLHTCLSHCWGSTECVHHVCYAGVAPSVSFMGCPPRNVQRRYRHSL